MIKEELRASNYEIVELNRSLIDSDQNIRSTVGIKCPHCKSHLKNIEHGEEQTCECGLKMKKLGSILHCTL